MNHWKINFILLVAVVALSTICMLTVGIDILRDLKVKDTQINVLIGEVGDLKASQGSETPAQTTSTIAYPQGSLPLTGLMATPVSDTTQTQSTETSTPQSNLTSYLLVGQHSQLTDSIMLVVENDDKKEITLISIPRDFAINGRKINEFYEFFGIESLAEQVAKITNIQPDKFIIVDMKAFQQFIDTIGGIDVTATKGIYDARYPLDETHYQTFSISAGPHHLDGATALMYARSRESTSDFDRSMRQQQIIQAVKTRLLSGGNFASLLKDLYGNIQKNIQTNVSFTDAITLLSRTSGFKLKTNNVLETSNLLYSTMNSKGQYILLPKTKNYDGIQKQVQDWINN